MEEGSGAKMTSDEMRASEKARREMALANRAGDVVVEGSGRAVDPRRLDQMVSLRLNPDLVAELRSLAEQSGRTVSELVREAVGQYVTAARASQVSFVITRVDSTLFSGHEVEFVWRQKPSTFSGIMVATPEEALPQAG
jgi:hypothetical protein